MTATIALGGVAGMWCVGLAMAMVLSEWCPWSLLIVQKKQFYAYFVGGMFMLGYGGKMVRNAFRTRPAEDGEPPELVGHDAGPH